MAKQTFEAWMAQVNAFVGHSCGLSAYDLPDAPYRDWYNDGVLPAAAAKRAVKRAKEF